MPSKCFMPHFVMLAMKAGGNNTKLLVGDYYTSTTS